MRHVLFVVLLLLVASVAALNPGVVGSGGLGCPWASVAFILAASAAMSGMGYVYWHCPVRQLVSWRPSLGWHMQLRHAFSVMHSHLRANVHTLQTACAAVAVASLTMCCLLSLVSASLVVPEPTMSHAVEHLAASANCSMPFGAAQDPQAPLQPNPSACIVQHIQFSFLLPDTTDVDCPAFSRNIKSVLAAEPSVPPLLAPSDWVESVAKSTTQHGDQRRWQIDVVASPLGILDALRDTLVEGSGGLTFSLPGGHPVFAPMCDAQLFHITFPNHTQLSAPSHLWAHALQSIPNLVLHWTGCTDSGLVITERCTPTGVPLEPLLFDRCASVPFGTLVFLGSVHPAALYPATHSFPVGTQSCSFSIRRVRTPTAADLAQPKHGFVSNKCALPYRRADPGLYAQLSAHPPPPPPPAAPFHPFSPSQQHQPEDSLQHKRHVSPHHTRNIRHQAVIAPEFPMDSVENDAPPTEAPETLPLADPPAHAHVAAPPAARVTASQPAEHAPIQPQPHPAVRMLHIPDSAAIFGSACDPSGSLYHEPQVASFCAVHALNSTCGGHVVSPDQMMAFRAYLRSLPSHERPSTNEWSLFDAVLEPSEDGAFDVGIIQAWLMVHTKTQLRHATSPFDLSTTDEHDPTRHAYIPLIPWLDQLHQAYSCSAFFCSFHVVAANQQHAFTIRRFEGGWFLIDSLLPNPLQLVDSPDNPARKHLHVNGSFNVNYLQDLPVPAAECSRLLSIPPFPLEAAAPRTVAARAQTRRFVTAPRHDPPLPSGAGRYVGGVLPPVGSWVWAVWSVNRVPTPLHGFVVEHEISNRAAKARVLWTDGEWTDLSIAELQSGKKHNSSSFKLFSVYAQSAMRPAGLPQSAVDHICTRMLAFARGTAVSKDDPRQDPAFRASLQALVVGTDAHFWHRAFLPPLPLSAFSEVMPALPAPAPVPPPQPEQPAPPLGCSFSGICRHMGTGSRLSGPLRTPHAARVFNVTASPPLPYPHIHLRGTAAPTHVSAPPLTLMGTPFIYTNRTHDAPQCLRMATHNVSGFTSASSALELFGAWHLAGLDLICLQETWCDRPQPNGHTYTSAQIHAWLDHAASNAGVSPYQVLWADNTSGPGNAGVAILWRPSSGIRISNHTASSDGRLQSVRVDWAGHAFTLVNTYWPAEGVHEREQFARAVLQPWCAQLQQPIVLMGDFNWVPDSARDRMTCAQSTAQHDRRIAAVFRQMFPAHVDALEARLPTHPHIFSYAHGTTGGARLDRSYLPPELLPHLAGPLARMHTPKGSHDAVCISLRPLQPMQKRGPGRRAIPHSLLTDPEVADELAQFCARATAHAQTLSDSELIQWFPEFSSTYANTCRMFHSEALKRRRLEQQQLSAASSAIDSAEIQLATAASQEQRAVAAADLHAARMAYHTVSSRIARPAADAAFKRWHLFGEQPSPELTARVHASVPASTVASLTDSKGKPATSNAAIVRVFVETYANVSKPPAHGSDLKLAAQRRILQSLRQQAGIGSFKRIPADLATQAGAANVSTAEVVAALKSMCPKTTPGPDGIPVPLWRVGDDCLAPMLAKLFTAIANTDSLPAGFHVGSITPILKEDTSDPTNATSYRPITLLNTSYRCFAKVHAIRFGEAMKDAIGPEQTAYLLGRDIIDNTLMSALLPDALHSMNVSAILFSIDFAKAFDTLDRDFLISVMKECGASEGMCRTARLILSDTYASVNANGTESQRLLWHAGVRQGCPLSPLLYVFAGQALASHLRSQPRLGVSVGGYRYVSVHHADDVKIAQADLSQPALDSLALALTDFEYAANQAVQLRKCSAVPMGPVIPGGLPPTLAGMPVVDCLISLGVPVQNSAPPPAQQPPRAQVTRNTSHQLPPFPDMPVAEKALQAKDKRVSIASHRIDRISSLPISVIGRGQSTGSYALSTFFYHTRVCGPWPEIKQVGARAERAVSCDIRPVSLLYGPPRAGGFGLLPLTEHMQAEHASDAISLIRALLALPDPGPANADVLPPHGCLYAPVAAVILRAAYPQLHPAQALLVSTAAPDAHLMATGILGLAAVFQAQRLPPGPLTNMSIALRGLGPLQSESPIQSALAVLSMPRPTTAAHALAMGDLFWQRPRNATHIYPARVSHQPDVHTLTHMLMHKHSAARNAAHGLFVHEALELPPQSNVSVQLHAFHSHLAACWDLRAPNSIKAALWQLAVNGIPGAHIPAASWECPCHLHGNLRSTGRAHTFWDCPIAQAVRQQLVAGLEGSSVKKAEVWTLRLPESLPANHPLHTSNNVWFLACMAAIAAMEYGRRVMWRARRAEWPDPGSRGLGLLSRRLPGAVVSQIIAPLVRAGRDQAVVAVSHLAVEHFWWLLQEFALLHPPAGPWQGALETPFLFMQDGVMRVRRPALALAHPL